MAKKIEDKESSSSAAAYLEKSALKGALEPPSKDRRVRTSEGNVVNRENIIPLVTEREIPLGATGESADIKKQFVLTQSTEKAILDAVIVASNATGARVKDSHFIRAMLKCLSHSMPQFKQASKKIGRMKLPGTNRGKEAERELFENKIAKALFEAFRSASDFEIEQ